MLIDDLRNDLVTEALKDPGRAESARYALAPCGPWSDYDRFERWSNGFNHRLERKGKPLEGMAKDWKDGWTTCDRLLCPEQYRG